MVGCASLALAAVPVLKRSLALLLLLSACLPARPRRDYAVSSEVSEYSPVVRLAVRVRLTDSLRVMVDSGTLLAPGIVPPGGGRALMRDLVLEAVVAEVAPDGMREASVPGTWRARATSLPVTIADSLIVGTPVRVPALTFVLPAPDVRAARRAWIVFRIRGSAVGTPMTLADGTVIPATLMTDGVRVHACAERTLTGHVDRGRARRQRADYLATC